MRAWWESLQARERLLVGGLGVFLIVVAIYGLLIEPLFSGAREYRERVATAERDLAWMRANIGRLPAGGAAAVTPSDQSLTVIVDSTTSRHRLVTASTRQVPPDGLRVKLDDAPFDNLVAWLGELHARHGVRLESATITQAGAKGTANANVTLRRPQG